MSLFLDFKKLSVEATIPTRAYEGDAGLDLYSIESVLIPIGARRLVKTGLAVAIPYGYVGLVHPRSGLANKYGVTVANAPGTIDAAYRGEIMVNLVNLGQDYFEVKIGDRIAQLVVQQVSLMTPRVVEELDETTRGSGGHGSTGS